MWYQRKHIAKIDGLEHLFTGKKPSKEWADRMDKIERKMSAWESTITTKGSQLGTSISVKSSQIKEKYKDRAWAKKLAGAFSRKKGNTDERSGSMDQPEEAEGERKESVENKTDPTPE